VLGDQLPLLTLPPSLLVDMDLLWVRVKQKLDRPLVNLLEQLLTVLYFDLEPRWWERKD
jgi:hypothetical protein